MEIIVEDGGRGGVEHESNIFALQPSESSENKNNFLWEIVIFPSLEDDQKQDVLKGNASTVDAFAFSEHLGCLPT